MQLTHKVDLNSLLDEKIRLTHNDINVHIFEIKAPDFIDNLSELNITMNIVDLWGNYVRINNEGLEGRNIRFRLSEFFKTIGTRTCEVVFSKEGKIYHAQKFKYHVEKNLDDDCSIIETEQYPILLELLDRVKKQLEETGTLNSEVEKLIDSIEDKLAKGEFDGRSVDFKIEKTRVGFKYSDEEEYEWVDLETKIPAPVMKEIEKIQFKADKSYVDSQVIQLKENIDTKVNQNEYDETIQLLKEDVELKAYKSELKTKLSEFDNDSKFITQDDVDLTEVNEEINLLKKQKSDITYVDKLYQELDNSLEIILETKLDKEELPKNLSEFKNDENFVKENELHLTNTIKSLDESIRATDAELKNKINLYEKGQADGVVPLNKDSKIALEYLPDLSKQQTHIVETVEDMQNLEKLLAGDKAFVVSSGDSYIWSGTEWKVLSKAEWENVNLDWANIVNNPLTSDDLINISKIPAKADKKDVPVKVEDLENGRETIALAKELEKNKVDKIEGKGLSTNDYTTVDKQQVAKIKDKANTSHSHTDREIWVDNKGEWVSLTDTLKAKADKKHNHEIDDINNLLARLQGIDNTISTKSDIDYVDKQIKEAKDLIDNIDIPEVDLLEINKSIADTNKELSKKVDKVDGKQLSTNDYTTVEKNKLAKLENYDDSGIKADIAKKADTLTVNTNLSKKVDKVDGKGLSTNDFTDVQMKKLATLDEEQGFLFSDVVDLKRDKADKTYVDKQVENAGKVKSVNDKTGEIVLTGTDIIVSDTWEVSIADILLDHHSYKASTTELEEMQESFTVKIAEIEKRIGILESK